MTDRTNCGCVDRINAELADKNVIVFANLLGGEVMITTEKRKFGKRQKPVFLFASHCPFCGVAYTQPVAVGAPS